MSERGPDDILEPYEPSSINERHNMALKGTGWDVHIQIKERGTNSMSLFKKKATSVSGVRLHNNLTIH